LKVCSSWVRGALASAALGVAATLGGCETDGTDYSMRALQPLSQSTLAELERRHMPKESPILVRLFKEEAELEVWKEDDTGRFALLKTYPICRWSGELGPKVKEGDRQAPEGFYTITPAQLNPNSHYYLAFDIGYPNAFDRAHGRTGGNLMIHGDCSSRGCYAMTDEQITEIYALARESFFGGQRAFQVQAYPFRMTAVNMAKHRNNPNMPFWKMLKEGSDHFEVMRLEPKVDICEKRYVFDAEAPANASPARPLSFNPTGQCPAYQLPQELADAVAEKQKSDDAQTAQLIARGVPVVPVKTGNDGGMNTAFLSKYKPTLVQGNDGKVRTYVERLPGTTPSYAETRVAEPRVAEPDRTVVASANASSAREGTYSLAGTESSQQPASAGSGSFFARLFGRGEDKKQDPAPQPAAAASAPKAAPAPARATATAAAKPAPKPEPQREARSQSPQPQQEARSQTPQAQPAPPAPQRAEPKAAAFSDANTVMPGAQPVVPAGFESRWSAVR
jgi:murein L,D-transpeptidase YafK